MPPCVIATENITGLQVILSAGEGTYKLWATVRMSSSVWLGTALIPSSGGARWFPRVLTARPPTVCATTQRKSDWQRRQVLQNRGWTVRFGTARASGDLLCTPPGPGVCTATRSSHRLRGSRRQSTFRTNTWPRTFGRGTRRKIKFAPCSRCFKTQGTRQQTCWQAVILSVVGQAQGVAFSPKWQHLSCRGWFEQSARFRFEFQRF